MRTATAMIVLLAGLPARSSAQDSTIQRSFGGHTVNLELSSGSYRLTGSSDGRIRVIPSAKSHPLNVRLDVNTFGTEATVKVSGPSAGSTVEIELPSRVNLVVTLRGASLQVSGIQGSKNISGDTGEIEVAMGNPAQYERVKATVRAGSVVAPRTAADKDGPRSFEWTGTGAHRLTVHLNSGTVTLVH